jgi:hypothetical protein
MSLAKQMLEYMDARGWQSSELAGDGYRLELHPMQSKLGTGFVLWRERGADDLELVISGHTEHDHLVTPEDEPLAVSEEISDVLASLLSD